MIWILGYIVMMGISAGVFLAAKETADPMLALGLALFWPLFLPAITISQFPKAIESHRAHQREMERMRHRHEMKQLEAANALIEQD